MFKKFKKTLSVLTASAITLTFSGTMSVVTAENVSVKVDSTSTVSDDVSLLPTAYDNLWFNMVKRSYLTKCDNGYMRVYAPDEEADNYIRIEYYDNSFELIEKKSIERELEYWGGFFEGENNYFTLEATSNTDEVDSKEVIRVIKYDKSWNKLGTAKITGNSDMFGGQIRYPLDYGCCETTELNGVLYIAMGHEGYIDPAYNQGHQGLLLLSVDESSMTGKIADCDLWHSFAQYLDNDGTNVYLFENSEGSGLSLLSQYTPSDTIIGNFDSQQTATVLDYGGERTSAWAIPTYADCYGVTLSEKNVLTLGTSIDQEKYGENTTFNIYVGVTPKDNVSTEATEVKWITNFEDKNDGHYNGVNNTYITKINDDCFMISWNQVNEESSNIDYNDSLSENVLHYIFIDGEGNKLTEEFTVNATMSDCKPIYDGENVVYYASDNSSLNFYTIDVMTGELTKKIYKVIGDNVIWNYENGVLTISGNGKMAENLSWSTELSNNVKKIIVEKGVENISDKAFSGFNGLEEVVIMDGLTSIGEQAFSYCDNLKEVTIPSSVKNIGVDIIWTGWYWGNYENHVYEATIYTQKGSLADFYAQQYGIACSYSETTKKGDANGDEKLDVRDAAFIASTLAKSLADTLSDSTDFNDDGKINVRDAAAIATYLASR